MRIEPDLAQSWSTSREGLTFTFKLRPQVKFHDGSALTSPDVKASSVRITNPSPGIISARRALYSDIAAVEAPDAQTVVFRFRAAKAFALDGFASPWNCISSAAQLKEIPATRSRGHGNGALQFRCPRQGATLGGQALCRLLPAGTALSRRIQGVFC